MESADGIIGMCAMIVCAGIVLNLLGGAGVAIPKLNLFL